MYHQPTNSLGNYNYNAFLYKNVFYPAHFHKNFELIYIKEGKLELGINGEHFLLYKGECYLVFPNTVHAFFSAEDCTFWIGVFSEDYIRKFSKSYVNKQFSKFKCDAENEMFLNKNLFYDGVPSLYQRIACLNLICDQLLCYAIEKETVKIPDLQYQILIYLSEGFTREISLHELANRLGYEYHYLSREFRRLFNMRFKEFVNYYRFEYACELLFNSNKSLTEIAMESGFHSIRTFNRIFKELSKMTPKEYRQNNVADYSSHILWKEESTRHLL